VRSNPYALQRASAPPGESGGDVDRTVC
jgi:hypothetical protein